MTGHAGASTPTPERLFRDPPRVPGLRFRLYAGPADIPGIVEVGQAANRADHFDYVPTVGELSNEIAHPDNFVPEQDILIAEVDGRIVGHGRVQLMKRDDVDTFELFGDVHPDYRRRRIGRAILHASERRARQRAGALTTDREIRLATWGPDSAVGRGVLLRAEGYEPVRFFFEMIKRDLSTPAARSLPDGLEMRPVTRDVLRQVFDAENEAFRDHWGHKDWSDAFFEELSAAPSLDLDLWRVAWAGDEVAGVVATYILEEENAALGLSRGWLERISVRRPWRGRGVATALILAACAGLRERGFAEGALGVDADNPSGALGLYESLGFAQDARATSWRKPLEAGATL
ncbi:MAG TPA: GNAT family N-acetyltransferase [Candidatus Acidoferrum sp.]|nr:GNAT family N-acetyltransferase [Candidatus Acidoferrum sp.]